MLYDLFLIENGFSTAMPPSNWMKDGKQHWRQHPAFSYFMAFLAVVAIALAQQASQSIFGFNPPLGLLLLPVLFSAIYGGGGPALLATALSVLFGWFFLIAPQFSFEIARTQDAIMLSVFTFVCLCMSFMGGLLKRAQKKEQELMLSLQQKEQTMRAMLGSAPQAVVGIDKEGRISIANEASFSVFGYRPHELIGQPVEVLFPERSKPGHAHFLGEFFSDAAATPFSLKQEMQGRKKDGRLFPIEASLALTETPSGALAVSFIADISERKKIEAELLRERSELKSILDHSPVLVSIKDPEGNIALANRSFLDMFNLSAEQVIGRRSADIYPADVGDLMSSSDSRVLATRQPTEFDIKMTDRRTGELHTYRTVKFPVRYVDTDEPFGVCSFSIDITQQKKAEEKILHAARHDPLTGLPNRALIYELGLHLLGTARRNNGKAAVLFFDLDRFKPINDTYGHTAGDKMLKEVARRLSGAVRSSDLVGRLGGDEFIAILGIDSEADVSRAALHLLNRLSEPYQIDTLELHTSPSIGISIYPNDGIEIDTLIRNADAAMYHAKSRGRNTFQFFTPEISTHTEKIFALEQKLRHSVRDHAFELVYQPIIDTQTMHVAGVEALIRWPQKSAAAMLPGQFIGAAETSGLINQIGEWVLQEACRQHQHWRKLGLPPMRIAINVSPIQFRSRDFQQRVGDAVLASGIDPSCVELEVTESTVMKQVEEAARTLASLKQLGLRIVLDDFGTGYSSLSYLSQFPIDKLKVDQSFIRHIDTDNRSLAITETVIALAKKLGVEVVAEGIESEEALDLLRERNCDLGQGFLISRPLSSEQFVEWYRRTDPRQLFH